jgi:hypothetical protein
MSRFESPLDNLRVASPCPADWNAMQGDDRKRFCGECKLNVYNLSGMTRYDAEHLLRMSEGRLCVRYFNRSDGTVLTKDCPVGWALVKKRVSVFAAAAFSLVLSLFASIFLVSMFKKSAPKEGPIMGAIAMKDPLPTPTPVALMGDVVPPRLRSVEVKGERVIPAPAPKDDKKLRPRVN